MRLSFFFRTWMTLWIFLAFCVHLPVSEGADPRKMRFDPVDFNPPKAERIELSKGMVLYFLENHELPLVNIQMMIRTGSLYETSDQVGLADLTATVMRTGGTINKNGDAIDEALEFRAIQLGISIGRDQGTANLNLLKKDLDQGLALFADILMHPIFEKEKLELAKRQVIEGIRRRNDSPHSVAARNFRKLLYGADHPYGRDSNLEGIKAIQRKDLVTFHKKYFHPNNVLIAVSGDIQKDEVIKKLNKVFSKWKVQDVAFPSVPSVKPVFEPSINTIFKDVPQTTIRIGHLGIKRENPDFIPLSVMNDILGGGGFASRLFQEIRTHQGLAYSVGSIFQPGNLDLGIFLAYSETKSATTLKTISAMIEEIEWIRKELVGKHELEQAKDSFLNSFVFSFSSPTQIVNRQMRLEYYGLPRDFLETFRDRVAQVTREDILRVAKRYLHPEGLIILTVGRQEEFENSLSTLGKVHEIPLEEVSPSTGG